MLQINNMFAYNKDTAIDLLIGFGFDRLDIEEMIEYLSADALDELAAERSGDDYELIADAYFCQINEAIGRIEEYLEADRITKAREKFEEIQNILENY